MLQHAHASYADTRGKRGRKRDTKSNTELKNEITNPNPKKQSNRKEIHTYRDRASRATEGNKYPEKEIKQTSNTPE